MNKTFFILMTVVLYLMPLSVKAQIEDDPLAGQQLNTRLDTLLYTLRQYGDGPRDTTYAELINTIAVEYVDKEKYQEALPYALQAAALYKTLNCPEEQVEAIENVAVTYYWMYDYPSAIVWEEQAVDLYRRLMPDKKEELAYALNLLSIYHVEAHQLEGTVELLEESAAIYKELYGENSMEYARSLANLGVTLSNYGREVEGLAYFERSLDILGIVLGEESDDYIHTALNLAAAFNEMSFYEKAVKICEKVERVMERKEIGTKEQSMCKNYLARAYNGLGYDDKAVEIEEQEVALLHSTRKETDLEYITALHNLAVYLMSSDLARSLDLELKVLDLRKRLLGESHILTIGSRNVLAQIYSRMGDNDKAEDLAKGSLALVVNHYGKTGQYYPSVLYNYGAFSFLNGHYDNTVDAMSNYVNYSSGMILEYFTGLNAGNRHDFWNKYAKVFTRELPYFTYYSGDGRFAPVLYDGMLLSKGLLLSADTQLRETILNSGDTVLLATYERLNDMRDQMEKAYAQAAQGDTTVNVDSLAQLVDQQEQLLVRQSAAVGDFTKNLRVKWQDVQAALKPEDLAIEFVRCPIDNDSVVYLAVTLRADSRQPAVYRLFEEKEIANMSYDDGQIATRLFEPLAGELDGISNIYFSPDGELYNKAIENLPAGYRGLYLSDLWNFYRLSSTRELAIQHHTSKAGNAVVYGGIRYDADVNRMAANSPYVSQRSRSLDDMPLVADSLHLRAGAFYLPATKTEAEGVEKTLSAHHISTLLKTDTLATERSFKELSGQGIGMLHVATHGFYWTEREATKMSKMSFLQQTSGRSADSEDKMLTRSGLLFAGANHVLKGRTLPEAIDDGILTAKEISQMDLRGLDLVVLSACQTGLGEIKGDGVFGLQRGFKKAGANTLLMTLWKVDDDATRLLMTHFYELLMSGHKKNVALRMAQHAVRTYTVGGDPSSADSHPYEAPQFWAAFILLDALD